MVRRFRRAGGKGAMKNKKARQKSLGGLSTFDFLEPARLQHCYHLRPMC
jgi:hypothetical protein